MITEDKISLATHRADLIERLAKQVTPEQRVALQAELSVVNAKIKMINTANAARLKADADKRKIAGLAEAANNAARARANLATVEDLPPDRQAVVDSWVDAVLDRAGITVTADDFVAKGVPDETIVAIQYLCRGIDALAAGEVLPALPNSFAKAAKKAKAR